MVVRDSDAHKSRSKSARTTTSDRFRIPFHQSYAVIAI
jgi:hypothetical protein